METDSRIPEKLFFKIGEVCELIKVQPHVLRYWETEFPMLAPQKNRAGQRVYRRKDVEMVLRIRDLLYEEKFTIAGAKKKLQDETRGGPRPKGPAREPVHAEPVSAEPVSAEPAIIEEAIAPPVPLPAAPPAPALQTTSDGSLSPQARLTFRVVKRDLEDLLTMLNSDASIKSQ
ncbi:MAG TPA: MerR family transcriptional regulator [Blastocatellia bacterium]|nr:MerR family transcriptional regulator [Blastocatellia bacterium]